ncbi:hypothetical protein DND13_05670 [Escherichia coli]|nr:hypothetical protein [Escherichia coli]EFN9685905.1 hypothetical protein [Escherichia coli]EFO2678431.1 hypothetical protein [Escherichia coli]EFO2853827.1 hypothetical protein [Escherichia coli]EGE0032949.1 hypothetical protein [Escherichia coli]
MTERVKNKLVNNAFNFFCTSSALATCISCVGEYKSTILILFTFITNNCEYILLPMSAMRIHATKCNVV